MLKVLFENTLVFSEGIVWKYSSLQWDYFYLDIIITTLHQRINQLSSVNEMVMS